MNAGRTQSTPSTARKIFDALTVLLFLAAIAAPTIDMKIRYDKARSPELVELRTPAANPGTPDSLEAAIKYPVQYEAYFKDSFGLRDQLLRWNSIVKVFGFGVSPSSEVYFGKQGWIFYNGEHSRENHRGAWPFAAEGLHEWAQMLEHKRALLASLGIQYLYVIAPDKETVYADLLPDFMHAIGPTRRMQLLAYMKEHAPKVEILDLSDALIAAKINDAPEDWVYGNLGTHWSGRGAQVALRTLLTRLNQLHPGFTPQDLDNYQRVKFAGTGDSWTTRMYIGDLLAQTTDVFKAPQMFSKVRFEGNFRVGRIRKSEIEGSSRPRLLMMHDSFGPHLELGLSEQCSYFECRWDQSIPPADLEQAAPNVFVDLYVERIFNHLDPQKLLPTTEIPWAARFEKATQALVSMDMSRPDWGLTTLGEAIAGPAVSGQRPRLPVTMKGPWDRLVLPALTPVAGGVPVLHVVLDSPFVTEFTLYYRAPGEMNFRRRNSYKRSLQRGTNDFYIAMDTPGTCGELLLRPGEQPGNYLLREFEIRSVEGP